MRTMIVAAAVLLASCQPAPRATQLPDRIPVASSLAGTKWRLVEFQSMDDAQGTRRPTNRSAYTMALGPDGQASFQFDCNRGTGPWKATESADAGSGTIEFGPIATTKMLCPAGTMGERLAMDTAHMRGWIKRDGRLAISLMADGGIYLWEPHDGT